MRGKNSARWHCRACRKTAFGSESRAQETIDRVSGVTEQGRRVPRRAYPCPHGNGWHTTSQEERRAG